MISYVCVLLLIILEGLFLLNNKNPKLSNIFFILVWVELTLIGGLRSVNVSRDTYNYFVTFNVISYISDVKYLSSHMELGFLYFNKFLSYISNSPQILFFVVCGFYVYTFLHFIKKYSTYPLLCIIIFFSAVPFGSYVFGISFLRQAIAIACFFFGIEQLINKKILFFIFFVLVGTMFHKSAIICLILLPLSYVSINAKTLVVSFFATIFFMIFFPAILPHIPFGVGSYSSYMLKEVADTSYLSAFLKAMCQLFISFSFIYFFTYGEKQTTTNRIFTWISILAFLCEFAAVRVLFMNRILYFTVFDCILIPYILSNIRKKELVIFTFIFFILFTFNNVDFWLRRAKREHLDQYEFFWDNPYGIVRWNLHDK